MSPLFLTSQVQGVFFRDNTVKEARKLGIVGWVQNTEAGTVIGEIQGPKAKYDEM